MSDYAVKAGTIITIDCANVYISADWANLFSGGLHYSVSRKDNQFPPVVPVKNSTSDKCIQPDTNRAVYKIVIGSSFWDLYKNNIQVFRKDEVITNIPSFYLGGQGSNSIMRDLKIYKFSITQGKKIYLKDNEVYGVVD